MRWVRAALVLTVGLAACSGGGTDDGASSGTPASATTGAGAAVVPATSTGPSTTAAAPTTTSLARARTVDELLALDRPIVLAHAGGEDVAPHSTPYAYALAVAAGVDVLDLDVQLSGDGVLIVQHDETLDRTTDAPAGTRVRDLAYERIRAFDNAYWFTDACTCRDQPDEAYVLRGVRTGTVPPPPGTTPEDFVVPTLREIAERWPDLPLNIEIKGTYPDAIATATALADELRALGRVDAAVVTSFDDLVLAAFAQKAPEVERSPGLAATAAFVLEGTPLPDGMRILQLPPSFQGTPVLTPELVARATAAGLPIWVWPNDRSLENLAAYAAFLDQGVAGLNANVPEQAVEAVRRHIGS